MTTFDERYKVSKTPTVKQNKTVELLMKYLEKDAEIAREFDIEDGIDVNAPDYEPDLVTPGRINALLDYRNIRVEQAYLSKVTNGDFSRGTRQMLNDLDHDRRRRHNHALTSLLGLVDFAKRFGLEPIYEGRLLTQKQINSHDTATLDIRKEMTDAFLKILKDIDDCPYSLVRNSKEMKSIKNNSDKNTSDFKVSKNLEHDDDDISFEDFRDEFRGF